MKTVGAFEAKTHLSSLLDAVEEGESILITRHGKEVAKIVPVKQAEFDPEEIIRGFQELRKQTRKSSMVEIISWKHEGHRL